MAASRAAGPVQRIGLTPKAYGKGAGLPVQRSVSKAPPALAGLFRAGRIVVGISQINAMATNVTRGGGG